MDFQTLFERSRSITLIREDRLRSIYDALCAVQGNGVPGAVAELGVYQGGSAHLIAGAAPERIVLLYDTFEGLPPVEPGVPVTEHHTASEFSAPLSEVWENLSCHRNLIYRPGFFPQSAETEKGVTFSFAHIDGDLYQTTRDALAFFWPRLSPGGCLVLDDYEWPDCPGVAYALREYTATLPPGAWTRQDGAEYQTTLWKT